MFCFKRYCSFFDQIIQNELIKVNLRDKNWKFNILSKATSIIQLEGNIHDIINTYNAKEYFNFYNRWTNKYCKNLYKIIYYRVINKYFRYKKLAIKIR